MSHAERTDAFFRAMTVAGRTRLLLIDAPAVFGWAGLCEIDELHGTRTLREGLAAAMDAVRFARSHARH